ncbi:7TM diverse intracellular signaling domain-containing protein [Sulfurovum sp. CS9]|uniref:7TM diverse intracellular signaling domain-containing protein n=1 Tax=Sulfurovum sp. CS9 TaxID=3391146 RepID=UPI0039EB71F5
MANSINISQQKQISLLENSSVYIDEKQLSIQDVLKQDLFEIYLKPYINIGTSQKTIWIKFRLQNPTQKPIEKSLILTSSLLEYIALYKDGDLNRPIIKGVSHITKEHTTLFPFYNIQLEAKTSQDYYLEVKSLYEPVDFGVGIQDKNEYLAEDRAQQFVNIMLIGMVLALMLYSFLVSFYTKDKSYSYYSFYLFFLVYQQMTYLGLTQIYFPVDFVVIDIKIPIIKVSTLLITASLFAMYFLKTKQRPILHKIYKLFVFIALMEMIILSIPGMYNLNIVIITGALFIIFNLSASIISYRQGYTQARLFIVGFSIVFFSYLLIILDAIGLTSIMQDFQNILMFGTAFEALILSLAFADRYVILQKEKEKVDAHMLIASKDRASIIENEVIKKTHELNHALKTKELLLKEIHHRVKNNLQVILSMIRLQNDEIEDKVVMEKFINLENRINAIAKTYNMLLIKDDLEEIDMQEYIDSLLWDIQGTVNYKSHKIRIKTDIDAMIPLRESVYIGLIINELVTNAYKYAFDDHKGTVFISLYHNENDFILTVEDDGKGFIIEENHKTLGLKLIHTLVYDQLGGDMEIFTNDHTKYIIRFTI